MQYQKSQGMTILEAVIAAAIIAGIVTTFTRFSLKINNEQKYIQQEYYLAQQIFILTERLYQNNNPGVIYRQWSNDLKKVLPTVQTYLSNNGEARQITISFSDGRNPKQVLL